MPENEVDDLIKDLIPWYLKEELENTRLLEKALTERNFSLLIEVGDKLYGHGATFGFSFISVLGKRIEIAAIQKDTIQISQLISSLKSYIIETLQCLHLE